MRNRIVKNPIPKEKSTVETITKLLQLTNQLGSRQFKNISELIDHGQSIVERDILEQDVDDRKYLNAKHEQFLYMHSNVPTFEHQKDKKRRT